MGVDSGIGFVITLNGVLLLLALLIYGYWLWRQAEKSEPNDDSAEEWYESATSLAHEVQQIAETSDSPINNDDIRRQLLPLSNQLKGHARAAPAGVNEEVIKNIYDLGMDCYKLGIEHTTMEASQTGVFMEDKLEKLRADAEELKTAVSKHRNQPE